LRPLFTITESLFSETRPERLLDLILNAICGRLRCNHSGYYRRGAHDQAIHLVAQKGQPLPEEPSNPEGGPVARSDALGMTLRVNSDGPGDPILQARLLENGLGSVLCTPLSRDVEHSVLMAGRDIGEPNFSAADVEMFGILTRQAAVALENARLYAELRDYVRQVEESQQALIQAEKMAAVGRLTASIAHEINNPLQGLGNCLHLARRDELDSEQREEYLKLADGELERLMSTVQRMLDFYRPSNLDRHISDANELINRVLILLRKQLDEHNVKVQTHLSEPLPKVLVVENQIQQVFFNLILNAMDAMPGGGELTIHTQGNNGFVDIYFRDTGSGVPDEVKERIFEPFLSTRDDGTGLGLSVSYNILDAHGGSIILVPDQIQGACFRVRLPIMETS
jgi:signal transduction histidine kinase